MMIFLSSAKITVPQMLACWGRESPEAHAAMGVFLVTVSPFLTDATEGAPMCPDNGI